MKAGFTIKDVPVKNGAFRYRAFRLSGWIDGQRIRKQFQSRGEAEGAKNELEVQAANRAGLIRAVNTRLSSAQVADAESAFARLGAHSLPEAIDWFLANYRPPQTATALETAVTAFLADRKAHVRQVVLDDYGHTLDRFKEVFAKRNVHEITTAEIQTHLAARNVGKKRYNNLRGELCTFFTFCMKQPRQWVRENPVAPIEAFKVSRGLPEILTAQKAAEVMAFVASYDGGSRGLPKGCMVPYFALCLFAGLRPSVPEGEIVKLANSPELEKTVDVALGSIRISPEVSKVKSVRQITIQPNLAAWLTRYPLKKFPIIPLGTLKMIRVIRDKFGIGQDVMRHTFISMHVAKFKSMAEAALEAGNSESMIRKHYYNLVSNADAEAFWSIRPAS